MHHRVNMNPIKALALGLAMKQAARGAQDIPFMAGQRLFYSGGTRVPQGPGPSARHGLRVNCSNPPNAITVGASSDRRTV
jgi:hypothetical protein